jgi:outer membrane receptor for ferrienterochelin and colicin
MVIKLTEMRAIILVVFMAFATFAAHAQADMLTKRVSISFNHVDLQDALTELQNLSGIPIAFNNKLKGMQVKVYKAFHDETFKSILDSLLMDKSLDYKIIGNQVTIFEKKSQQIIQGIKRGSITGVVIDEKTGKPIPYVNVAVARTYHGTATDDDGIFKIAQLIPGNYKLRFSSIGYTEKNVGPVELKADQILDLDTLFLKEGAIELNEVTVSPGSFSVMGTKMHAKQSLTERDIKNMSWAEDITRAVTRLPGIYSTDFSSKFTIRGGESDEVLMNLDGMELYDPFHQRDISGGLFSIVDIETIQGIDLMTGGFPAEYGNRQSGVFNMKTKQAVDGERHASIGLSMMNARLYTDGTFAKNRGSYLFSARRGMLDLIFKMAYAGESIPYYADAMGKVEYKLNDKHVLSFHTLYSYDKTNRSDLYLTNYDSSNIRYSGTYSWLTLKSFYSPALYSRTMLFGGYNHEDRNGSYEKDEYGDLGTFFLKDIRTFYFVGIKQDWNWQASDRLIFKTGFDARYLQAGYDYYYSLEDIRINNNDSLINSLIVVDVNAKPQSRQANMYLSIRFRLFPKLFLETGLRYDYHSHTRDNLWSPRISVAYSISKNTFLRGAWGYYYQSQFINNLDVNHNASQFNSAELSEHFVLGLEHIFNNGINIRLEGYYKNMPRINPIYQNLRDPLEVFPEARNDVVKLNIAGTKARGIELFLKYDRGKKISWWVSYALAKAEDDIISIGFDGLLTPQLGKTPRNTGQNHTIYADLNYRPNEKWHFSVAGQMYTGWHRTNYHYNWRTMPDGRLIFYPVHEVFNGTAYPLYHRMDLRINRHFQIKKGIISAYLHVINLYNHKNLRKFDLGATDDNEQLIPDGKGGYITPRGDKYWFGFTPIIGLSWEI